MLGQPLGSECVLIWRQLLRWLEALCLLLLALPLAQEDLGLKLSVFKSLTGLLQVNFVCTLKPTSSNV